MAESLFDWQDCLKESSKNHPDLISAQAKIKESQATKDITASGVWPQINANAGFSRTGNEKTNETTHSTTKSISDAYSYGLSGSLLIFDGLKSMREIQSASKNIEALEEAYRFSSATIRFNLRSAFIDLLKAQELVVVAKEILKIREKNLELISLRYQSGLEHEGAFLTAQADVSQANLDVKQAQRDVVLAQKKLNKEMGRNEFVPIEVKADFFVTTDVQQEPNFEDIIKKNPSLLQAVAKKEASALNVKASYSNFFPQLSGNVGVERSGSDWAPQDDGWSVGLRVTVPIFEGKLKTAQVSQAKALLEQAKANEKSVKNSLMVNLTDAWLSLQNAVENVDVQRKALEATMKRSSIAEAQYSIGFINFDNWTIIENNLVTAKKSFLNAQANMLMAEAQWILSRGETLEYE